MGSGALDNRNDPPPAVQKQHVERQKRVLHPHADRARPSIIEQHAGVNRQGPSMHKAPGVRIEIGGQFHREAVTGAVGGFDDERR